MKKFSLFGQSEKKDDYDSIYRDDDFYGDDSGLGDDAIDLSTSADKASDDQGYTVASPAREGVSFNANTVPVSLKVVKPSGYSDGPAIADYLAAGSTVVLNIEDLSRDVAIRLIDFLMGAVHVLGGDMKSVTKTTLVFAPKNVGVSDFDSSENA